MWGWCLVIVLGASASAAITRIDTTPPTAPPAAHVTARDATSLTLSWAASRDGSGVKGYSLTLNGTQAGTTPTLSWRFTGLTCGSSYALSVRAYDAAGNYSAPDRVSASTAACPSPPARRSPARFASRSLRPRR